MSYSFDNPALGPPRASLWSVPVQPLLWPTSRWMTQIVSGIVLDSLFGLGLAVSPFALLTVIFGVCFGLTLACTVNGFLVGLCGRRLSFVSTMLYVVLTPMLAAPVLPPLNGWGRAELAARQGGVAKLRELVKEFDGADFRYAPARAAAVAGLQEQYAPVRARVAALPMNEQTDRPLREAVATLLDELAGDADPTVRVAMTEKLDASIPDVAKVDLLLYKLDDDFKRWPGVPLKPTELTNMFTAQEAHLRTDHVARALAREFAKRIEPKYLRFKALEQGEAAAGKRVLVLHADVRHSGHYIKTNNQFGAPGLSAQPTIAWRLSVQERDGRAREATSFVVTPGERFNIKYDYQEAGEYSSLLSAPAQVLMAYLKFAWETSRRIGFDAGAEPTRFP